MNGNGKRKGHYILESKTKIVEKKLNLAKGNKIEEKVKKSELGVLLCLRKEEGFAYINKDYKTAWCYRCDGTNDFCQFYGTDKNYVY